MDFDDLLDRIVHLRSVLSDPDRPFYQVEISNILYDLSVMLEAWDDEISFLKGQVAQHKVDIEGLTNRYSELQYKVAEIMQSQKAF